MDISAGVRRLDRLWTILEAYAVEMADDARSDCLLWALRQQQREGGAVVVQPSAYGRFHHVQWCSPLGELWEFVPVGPKVPQMTIPTLFAGAGQRVGRHD